MKTDWRTGRPPEEEKEYLVTVKHTHFKRLLVARWYPDSLNGGCWGVYDGEVTAWTELPGPYGGRTAGKEKST